MASDAIPTAEDKARYEEAKKELIEALTKKRTLDKQLGLLEVQIYQTEATYLTETMTNGGGNVIQGFDNYLKNPSGARRRTDVTDADRMFSNSSATYQKSLELHDADESGADIADAPPASTSGITTISLPPARPAADQPLSHAAQKKLRDRDYQRKKRANARQKSENDGESDEETASISTAGRRPQKRAKHDDD